MPYPPEAYAPNGELWWLLKVNPEQPGRRYGDERKIAAYLACTKQVGDTFTTKELREQIRHPGGGANAAEHLQRRMRVLRGKRDGWQIVSHQDDRTLEPEHYRIEQIGWHPGLGPRAKDSQAVSAKTRSLVLRRDGSRCQVCGIGDGEPYPEQPDKTAVMTVGHVLSREFEGKSDLGNLRAECALCNEQLRSEGAKPESVEEVWAVVRKLRTPDIKRLQQWIALGYRSRDSLDEAYDRVRKLAPADRAILEARIEDMTKPRPTFRETIGDPG